MTDASRISRPHGLSSLKGVFSSRPKFFPVLYITRIEVAEETILAIEVVNYYWHYGFPCTNSWSTPSSQALRNRFTPCISSFASALLLYGPISSTPSGTSIIHQPSSCSSRFMGTILQVGRFRLVLQ